MSEIYSIYYCVKTSAFCPDLAERCHIVKSKEAAREFICKLEATPGLYPLCVYDYVGKEIPISTLFSESEPEINVAVIIAL